jgi:DNA-binding CsgD family transcriptional regulator
MRGTETIRDLASFQRYCLEKLPQLIGAEITGISEVDLQRSASVTAMEPADARFAGDEEIFTRFAHQHPLVKRYAESGDVRALKISDLVSQAQFHRLELYQEYFKRVGIEDQLAFTMPATPPRVLGVVLSRDRRSFRERDRLLLDLVRPCLVQAYERMHVLAELEVLRRALEHAAGGTSAPALADAAGIAREAVAGGATLCAIGLSKREAEVLLWVARGKTNAEVGDILRVSHRTVAKHLERIYEKLGVENRTAAAARMLEIAALASGDRR